MRPVSSFPKSFPKLFSENRKDFCQPGSRSSQVKNGIKSTAGAALCRILTWLHRGSGYPRFFTNRRRTFFLSELIFCSGQSLCFCMGQVKFSRDNRDFLRKLSCVSVSRSSPYSWSTGHAYGAGDPDQQRLFGFFMRNTRFLKENTVSESVSVRGGEKS